MYVFIGDVDKAIIGKEIFINYYKSIIYKKITKNKNII